MCSKLHFSSPVCTKHRLPVPPPLAGKSVWLHYHDLWRLESPLNVLSCFSTTFSKIIFTAAIKSQFIEIPHEQIHVGDDSILKCLVDDHKSRADASYVWYFNSESHEMKKLYWFSPFARFVSFFSSFAPLPVVFPPLLVAARPSDAKQIKKSPTTSISS